MKFNLKINLNENAFDTEQELKENLRNALTLMVDHLKPHYGVFIKNNREEIVGDIKFD